MLILFTDSIELFDWRWTIWESGVYLFVGIDPQLKLEELLDDVSQAEYLLTFFVFAFVKKF